MNQFNDPNWTGRTSRRMSGFDTFEAERRHREDRAHLIACIVLAACLGLVFVAVWQVLKVVMWT